MADDTGGPGNGLLYGLLGALCAIVIGGGVYVYHYNQALSPVPQAGPVPADPTAGQDRPYRRENASRIAPLVEAARAAIARRDYSAADRALDEAERIDARDPAVVRTRNELQEAAARPDRRDGRN